jgi:hypothetical protein
MLKLMLILIGIYLVVIVAVLMRGVLTHIISLSLVALLLAGILDPKRGRHP